MNPRKVFLVGCAVIAVIAIALILRLIPPNGLFGFRTDLALSNPDLWYSANAFSGWMLAAAAALSAVIVKLVPARLGMAKWFQAAVLIATVAVAIWATLLHLRTYA